MTRLYSTFDPAHHDRPIRHHLRPHSLAAIDYV